MTVGDTLIAFGLLAIIVILTCEACWRARLPRWQGARDGAGRIARPFRNALGGVNGPTRVEGQQQK